MSTWIIIGLVILFVVIIVIATKYGADFAETGADIIGDIFDEIDTD